MNYTLWVDTNNKHLSLRELQGFSKYVYASEAGLNKVIQLLSADGYQMAG